MTGERPDQGLGTGGRPGAKPVPVVIKALVAAARHRPA
jgi:hypothetical protein